MILTAVDSSMSEDEVFVAIVELMRLLVSEVGSLVFD